MRAPSPVRKITLPSETVRPSPLLAVPLLGLLVLSLALFVPGRGGEFHASPVEPPLPLPDFTLGEGADAFHSGELRGSYVALFFGFTHCPDVCPLTLQRLAAAREQLGRGGRRLRVLFVSVDPERDDAATAASYARAFHPEFIGASGTPDQLRALTADYGIYFRRADAGHEGHGAEGYGVDHTASTLVLNPRGELEMLIPYGQGAGEIAADLRRLMR